MSSLPQGHVGHESRAPKLIGSPTDEESKKYN